MQPTSPFASLGLFRNPFGELTQEERAELAVVDVAGILQFLQSNSRSAVQILGDCGFGKTTHLLALRAARDDARLVYFPAVGPKPEMPTGTGLLLVDEAQRMGWFRRRQMLSWRGPLVVATHVDMSRQLASVGFEVACIDVEVPKTPRELVEILNRRIGASRLSSGSVEPPQIDVDDAKQLIERFHSNLRAIESELFERFQSQVSPGLPTA